MVIPAVSRQQILEWLGEVPDPEIPVLSIIDLGIVRDVHVSTEVTVDLTPTYSGCPATEFIEKSVLDALHNRGVDDVSIRRVLSPPWTTDWISDAGLMKLKEYGIAPPEQGGSKYELLHGSRHIACPQCDSSNTSMVSEFGATACKAHYKCNDCLEPFEYFKCI